MRANTKVTPKEGEKRNIRLKPFAPGPVTEVGKEKK